MKSVPAVDHHAACSGCGDLLHAHFDRRHFLHAAAGGYKEALAEFRKQLAARHPTLGVETGLMALDGKVETL